MAETTGERLKRLRGKRKLREVAEATGVAISTLSAMEHDKRSTSDENKRRIAEYYGRTVEHIFFKTVTREMRDG